MKEKYILRIIVGAVLLFITFFIGTAVGFYVSESTTVIDPVLKQQACTLYDNYELYYSRVMGVCEVSGCSDSYVAENKATFASWSGFKTQWGCY